MRAGVHRTITSPSYSQTSSAFAIPRFQAEGWGLRRLSVISCSVRCDRTLYCFLVTKTCSTFRHSLVKQHKGIDELSVGGSRAHAWKSGRRQRSGLASQATAMHNGATRLLSDGVPGFADRETPSFSVGILGDLHLEPAQMHLFEEARAQLAEHLAKPDVPGARVVQLGDLGGYSNRPGTRNCFEVARDYLRGLPIPAALVTGNHDLEGDEFETDEDNLAAWTQVFGQRHYWAAEMGPAVFIGLSTVRFRSNLYSAHEVYIDDEQLQWFESTLEAAGDRPVVVFTHAPPLGCGLKVLQEVHVKNRCAWLNHSSSAEVFMQILQRHPNISLWFSGHFHLSHNYADSISVVGRCAFVQTGVIGECNRDGFRHSRVLKGDEAGYQVFTLDHDIGELRLDLQHRWDDPSRPKPLTPPDELICDPNSGWLCSQLDCEVEEPGSELVGMNSSIAGPSAGGVLWYPAGARCLLALQGPMLVEYDAFHQAPIGVVFMEVGEKERVRLVDAEGREVPDPATPEEDGSRAVAVELVNPAGAVTKRVERNSAGGFFAIFQQNKWRLKKAKEAAAAKAKLSKAGTISDVKSEQKASKEEVFAVR